MTGNHREATVLHRPLLILSAVTVMGYVVGGEYWAVTAFLCVFAMGVALTISLNPTWAIGFIGILWISMIMVWLLWKLESESY